MSDTIKTTYTLDDKVTPQLKKIQKQLKDVIKTQKQVEDQTKKSQDEAADQYKKTERELQEVQEEARRTARSMSRIGEQARRLKKVAGKMPFMSTVRTQAERVKDGFKRASDGARAFGTTVKEQAKKATAALKQVLGKTDQISKKLKGVGDKLTSTGQSATTKLTLPIVAGFGKAIKDASDYQENINKVETSFKKQAGSVKAWAKTATAQFGLSESKALEITSQFGDMGTSMGLSDKKAAAMSKTLAGLAGDLASFKNISADEALTALNGVFTGETESLKQLGVVMTQENLENFAQKQNKYKSMAKPVKQKDGSYKPQSVLKQLDQAEKLQLRYEYVMAMTKNAQGDYSKTSDGTANSTKTLTESLNNLSVSFGTQLLPIFTPLVQKLTQVVQWIGRLSDSQKKVILIIAAILAAIGPVLIIVGTLCKAIAMTITVIKGLGTAIRILGVALKFLAANPIILIIAAIVAVVVAFIYLWRHCESFRNFWIGVWNKIKSTVSDIVSAIGPTIQSIREKLQPFIDKIKELWQNAGGLKGIMSAVWNGIKTVVSAAATVIISVILGITFPIRIVISAIRHLWKTSSTFRGICTAVWGAIRKIVVTVVKSIINRIQTWINTFSKVVSAIKQVLDKTGALKKVKEIIKDAWSGLKHTLTSPFSAVLSTINSVISAFKTLADYASRDYSPKKGAGGGTANPTVGKAGKNATGTHSWKGGWTWVGERGPELVNLNPGTKILNHKESMQATTTKQFSIAKIADSIVVREDADIDRIATALVKKLTDVQSDAVLA